MFECRLDKTDAIADLYYPFQIYSGGNGLNPVALIDVYYSSL